MKIKITGQRLRVVGILLTLVGVALLMYNLFSGNNWRSWEPEERMGIAFGAVLIVGGLFVYREAAHKGGA